METAQHSIDANTLEVDDRIIVAIDEDHASSTIFGSRRRAPVVDESDPIVPAPVNMTHSQEIDGRHNWRGPGAGVWVMLIAEFTLCSKPCHYMTTLKYVKHRIWFEPISPVYPATLIFGREDCKSPVRMMLELSAKT